MIYIVHGNNYATSRTQTLNLQKKHLAETREELSINELSPLELLGKYQAKDLFGKNPFIILDISLAGRMKLDEYITVLKKVPTDAVLIILSSKELSKANAFIKSALELKTQVLVNNKIPTSNVFSFVDAVFSKKRENTYRELKNLIEDGEDEFYLFSMILYGLRNIAYCKFNSPNVNKMAPFTKSKAQKQSDQFSEEQIKTLFKELYEIDKGVKTGIVVQSIFLISTIEKIILAGNT